MNKSLGRLQLLCLLCTVLFFRRDPSFLAHGFFFPARQQQQQQRALSSPFSPRSSSVGGRKSESILTHPHHPRHQELSSAAEREGGGGGGGPTSPSFPTTQPPTVDASSSSSSSSSSSGEMTPPSSTSMTLPFSLSLPSFASSSSSFSSSSPSGPTKPKINLPLIRLTFFLFYASLGSLLPYFPVYYHHLGLRGRMIGLLGAIPPFTTFVFAPLWALYADSTGRHSNVLLFTFLVSTLFRVTMLSSTKVAFLASWVFVTAAISAPVKPLLDSQVLRMIRRQEAAPAQSQSQSQSQSPTTTPTLQQSDSSIFSAATRKGAAGGATKVSSSGSGSYGRLRLYGQFGFGLSSSLTGLLLHGPQKGPGGGFGKAFAAHAVICLPTAWAIWTLLQDKEGCKRGNDDDDDGSDESKVCARPHVYVMNKARDFSLRLLQQMNPIKRKEERVVPSEGPNAKKGLMTMFRDPYSFVFFLLIFIIGVSSGIIENFAYIRLMSLGGGGFSLGFSRLFSSLAGIPMFWYAESVTDYLGVPAVLLLTLVSYAVRFVNYSTATNWWSALPAEALRGAFFGLFWSTATMEAHRLYKPSGMAATGLAVMNAMYGGLGQSLGSVLGGWMQDRLGSIVTAFYWGAAADMVVVLCAAVFYSYPLNRKNRITTVRNDALGGGGGGATRSSSSSSSS